LEGPLLEHATKVVPSRHLSLAGRNFWKAGMRRLQRACAERMDPAARAGMGIMV